MSLKKQVKPQGAFGFVNVTYSDLWRKVRENLGFYAKSATQKWTTYLIDFMETTESLGGECMDLTDRDWFFIENKDIAEKFVKDRESLISQLNAQIVKLKDIIENSEEAPKQFEKRWIYLSSCLVHDYILSGNKVAFDLFISSKGWELQLFGRNLSSNNYITQLVSARRDELSIEDGRFTIAHWPLNTGLEDIKEKLCNWMTWIIQEDARNSLLRATTNAS